MLFCPALEVWPDGKYALPRPVYDCPSQSLHNWTNGVARIQLRPLQFNMSASSWSPNFHHLGTNEPNEFIITTCATRYDEPITYLPTEKNRQEWPQGSYCIYKTGDNCPNGLCIYYFFLIIKEIRFLLIQK